MLEYSSTYVAFSMCSLRMFSTLGLGVRYSSIPVGFRSAALLLSVSHAHMSKVAGFAFFRTSAVGQNSPLDQHGVPYGPAGYLD
jgi:hypothetical protein